MKQSGFYIIVQLFHPTLSRETPISTVIHRYSVDPLIRVIVLYDTSPESLVLFSPIGLYYDFPIDAAYVDSHVDASVAAYVRDGS